MRRLLLLVACRDEFRGGVRSGAHHPARSRGPWSRSARTDSGRRRDGHGTAGKPGCRDERAGPVRLPGADPGSYSVKVMASGYATVVQSGVEVYIGRKTQLPFALSPGRVEEVTVTSEAPLVDMKSTAAGESIKVDNFAPYVPVGRTSCRRSRSPGRRGRRHGRRVQPVDQRSLGPRERLLRGRREHHELGYGAWARTPSCTAARDRASPTTFRRARLQVKTADSRRSSARRAAASSTRS